MTRGRARRRWSFAILVLVAGCFVSGAHAQSRRAKKPVSSRDTSLVLIKIGKGGITRQDVQERIDQLPEQFRKNYSTPDGRQRLLDRMLEEHVWLALAEKEGISERPEVRQQIEQQSRDLLIRTYLNELMASNPAPSDSEAQAYYQEHIDEHKLPGSITLRHIQTSKEADARRVLRWAKRNYDWDKLVTRYSRDSLTRSNGGSLGIVTREGVFSSLGPQPALAESAFTIPAGEVGGPFKTDRGWHVIKVDAIQEESVRPFDQARQVILRQLSSTRSQDFYRTRLEDARRSLGVVPDSAAIKMFLSQQKSARDMFNEAQTLGPAAERIAAYQQVLDAYPDADVSPQAQFMVGFIYSEELKEYERAEAAFRQLLQRYPKAELASSAQWMIDHMRSDEAPAFIELNADSSAVPASGRSTNQESKPR